MNADRDSDEEPNQDSQQNRSSTSNHSDDHVERAQSDHILDANESFRMDDNVDSDSGSFDGIDQQQLFTDMKDDRQIVRIAASNDEYKLV